MPEARLTVSPYLSTAFDGTRATPTRPLFTKVWPWKLTDWADAVAAPSSRAAGRRLAKIDLRMVMFPPRGSTGACKHAPAGWQANILRSAWCACMKISAELTIGKMRHDCEPQR